MISYSLFKRHVIIYIGTVVNDIWQTHISNNRMNAFSPTFNIPVNVLILIYVVYRRLLVLKFFPYIKQTKKFFLVLHWHQKTITRQWQRSQNAPHLPTHPSHHSSACTKPKPGVGIRAQNLICNLSIFFGLYKPLTRIKRSELPFFQISIILFQHRIKLYFKCESPS